MKDLARASLREERLLQQREAVGVRSLFQPLRAEQLGVDEVGVDPSALPRLGELPADAAEKRRVERGLGVTLDQARGSTSPAMS